jgi:hypothetical protein
MLPLELGRYIQDFIRPVHLREYKEILRIEGVTQWPALYRKIHHILPTVNHFLEIYRTKEETYVSDQRLIQSYKDLVLAIYGTLYWGWYKEL